MYCLSGVLIGEMVEVDGNGIEIIVGVVGDFKKSNENLFHS